MLLWDTIGQNFVMGALVAADQFSFFLKKNPSYVLVISKLKNYEEHHFTLLYSYHSSGDQDLHWESFWISATENSIIKPSTCNREEILLHVRVKEKFKRELGS